MTANNHHQVRVLRYVASDRPTVQGFADVEIDRTWRLNGINLRRDSTITPGMLTPLINYRRVHIPSIEILDPALRELFGDRNPQCDSGAPGDAAARAAREAAPATGAAPTG